MNKNINSLPVISRILQQENSMERLGSGDYLKYWFISKYFQWKIISSHLSSKSFLYWELSAIWWRPWKCLIRNERQFLFRSYKGGPSVKATASFVLNPSSSNLHSRIKSYSKGVKTVSLIYHGWSFWKKSVQGYQVRSWKLCRGVSD